MKYLQQFVTTSLNVGGGIDASQTTGIVLQSLNNIDETKPSVACLSWADPLSTSVAEWVTYTSINSTTNELQGVTRGAEGYSAKQHLNQAVVAFPLSKSHVNDLNDILTSTTGAITATLDEDDMSSNSATALATQQSIKAYVDTQDTLYTNYNIGMARQAIINGNFDVSQRATTFVAGANNDDVYTLDQWNLISDGNDVLDVSQEAITDLPGSNYAIKLDVETAKRAGIVQFLEAKDAQKFKGKSVSISFAVKSANISAIRATVLSWASTADSITSDVVGTWGATPTWATNWTAENTPADLTVTSSWTTVKVENIAIDSATVNNLALAIWLPNEETIGDIIYITQVQMNEGTVALPFQPKSFEEELRKCQRYYYYSGSGTTGTTDGFDQVAARFYSVSTANILSMAVTYPVEMRVAATPVLYASNSATGAGTANRVRDEAVGGLIDISSPTNLKSTTKVIVYLQKTGAFTASRFFGCNYAVSAEL